MTHRVPPRGADGNGLRTAAGSSPAASQQWARVWAENPGFHCFSGSARNACQSEGPEVGRRIFFIRGTSGHLVACRALPAGAKRLTGARPRYLARRQGRLPPISSRALAPETALPERLNEGYHLALVCGLLQGPAVDGETL